jgi:hypothetical protein
VVERVLVEPQIRPWAVAALNAGLQDVLKRFVADTDVR